MTSSEILEVAMLIQQKWSATVTAHENIINEDTSNGTADSQLLHAWRLDRSQEEMLKWTTIKANFLAENNAIFNEALQ